MNVRKTRIAVSWKVLSTVLLFCAVAGSFGLLPRIDHQASTNTSANNSVNAANPAKSATSEVDTEGTLGYRLRWDKNSAPTNSPTHQANARSSSAAYSGSSEKPYVTKALSRRGQGASDKQREDALQMPEWEKIFNPGGTLKDDVNERGFFGSNGIPDFVDLYNGVEAEFIQENLSNGIATDSSALLIGSKLSEEVLFNGPVSAAHDLGNGYVLATIGADGHLRLYAGAERLITDTGTFIEFEFNQDRVHLSSGAPWPLVGERNEGDLLVRMVYSNRVLQSVELVEWQQGGYQFIDSGAGISGDSCYEEKAFMYCVGPPPIRHPLEGFETWDEDNQPVDPVVANDFVEIGIDVDRLVGTQTQFAGVLIRTPEDIAINSFRYFGPFSLSGTWNDTRFSSLWMLAQRGE